MLPIALEAAWPTNFSVLMRRFPRIRRSIHQLDVIMDDFKEVTYQDSIAYINNGCIGHLPADKNPTHRIRALIKKLDLRSLQPQYSYPMPRVWKLGKPGDHLTGFRYFSLIDAKLRENKRDAIRKLAIGIGGSLKLGLRKLA